MGKLYFLSKSSSYVRTIIVIVLVVIASTLYGQVNLVVRGDGAIVSTTASSVNSNIHIENNGTDLVNGCTFYIVDKKGTSTTNLQTNPIGTIISPSSINGDTIFYTITPAIISEFGNNNGIKRIVKLFLL